MTPTVFDYEQYRCEMNLFNLKVDSTVFKSGNYSFLYLLSLIMCESNGKK